MTDAERLAALLRDIDLEARADAALVPQLRGVPRAYWDYLAARLVAAGVRVGEGCPSCGAPRSGCNDCGWKPEQPIVALAPIKQVELFEVSIVKDPPHPSWTIRRIDPDRLARALQASRVADMVHESGVTHRGWSGDLAAEIVKAYEEEP